MYADELILEYSGKQKKVARKEIKISIISGSPIQVMVNQIQCFGLRKAEFLSPLLVQDYLISYAKHYSRDKACRDKACRDKACRDKACRDKACRDKACRDKACRDKACRDKACRDKACLVST